MQFTIAENKYCKPPHQKKTFFIARKLVVLSLDILPSKKTLKGLLQNI